MIYHYNLCVGLQHKHDFDITTTCASGTQQKSNKHEPSGLLHFLHTLTLLIPSVISLAFQ